MDVLVIAGERQAVRYAERIFDCYEDLDDIDMTPFYTKDELKLIKRARITFVEEAFSVLDKIDDEEYIIKEELKLQPDNIASNYNEVQSIVNNIFEKVIDYANSNGEKIDVYYKYNP